MAHHQHSRRRRSAARARQPHSHTRVVAGATFALLVVVPVTTLAGVAPQPPSDAACAGFPSPVGRLSFSPGELLSYDLDAMGAHAGTLEMKVLPMANQALPVEAVLETNSFVAKLRRVVATGRSLLSPVNLRPIEYREESTENLVVRTLKATFDSRARVVDLSLRTDQQQTNNRLSYAAEGLDVAGTLYRLRQLPLREKQSLCFDAFGVRKMWRVWGTVVATEHLSLPVGEFEARHIEAFASRLDNTGSPRAIHLWISNDAKRLPLVAMAVFDTAAVRATLKAYHRPGETGRRSDHVGNLKW